MKKKEEEKKEKVEDREGLEQIPNFSEFCNNEKFDRLMEKM